jgi:glycosyltransferase involved in cell wall biosynthesis
MADKQISKGEYKMFISVVMAVYNGEQYLEEAVNSVLNQTYPQFELIIVNDGSTDRTREILNKIHDHRVKIIHSETNQGAAASLNLGIYHTSGDWIAIHDADDISEPTRLEDQAGYLQTHPDSTGVGSLIAGRIGSETVVNPEVEYYNRILDKEQIIDYRFLMCYLCHGSVIFSKQKFYDVGRYNPKYKISYDYELWLRLFDISPIEKIPKVLYHYRLRNDSLGKQNTKKTITELMTISSLHIYNKLLNKKKRKPVLAIIGSKRGCSFFKRKVGMNFINIYYVPVSKRRDLRKIYMLYKLGKIHAVIVLNNRISNTVVKHMMNKGFRWNKNLFKIWNYHF